MDPVTAAVMVSVVSAGAGATMQYQGQRQSAKAQEAMQKYNADVARQQGKAEEQAALAKARRLKEATKAQAARQRAMMGKAGVTAEGTPLLVAIENAERSTLDQLTMMREGAVARGAAEQRAGMNLLQARQTKRAGKTAGYGTILSGVTGLAQMGLEYSEKER